MNTFKALFKAGRRTPGYGALFLSALLSFAWVTPAAATDWTFDWNTLGWNPNGAGSMPRTYTNVAGSSIDVRVTTSITGGSWLTGYPVLNNDPGQDDELNLRVDFANRDTTTGATVLIEFFQTGTTTPAPVAMKGIAVRDVDRQQPAVCFFNQYQDVVTVTAVNQSGTTINPDFISQFTTTPNWTDSGGNTISAKGNAGIDPNNQNGWASFNFATQTIRSMTLQYKPGDGGGCGNPTQQWLWISDFVFSDQPTITQAVISSFQVGGDGSVEWETASEVGTVGFNLLRQDPASGEFARVNDGLLPGLTVLRTAASTVTRIGRWRRARLTAICWKKSKPTDASATHGPFTVTAGVGKQFARAERALPLTADVEAAPRADGYGRVAHAPSGRAAPPLATRPRAATKASTPKTVVRIQVEQEGLYAVSTNQIAVALDADPQQVRNWITKGRLRLQNKGQSVAWMADSSGDQLYFYGQAIQGVDGVYTRFNVYWLDKANGLVMDVLNGQGPSGTGAQCCFQSSIHVEENQFPAPLPTLNPDADFWYWDYAYMAVNDPGRVAQLTVPTPGAASTGTVTLRANLQGSTALAPAGVLDHHARLRVNDAEVGQGAWAGIAPYELTATFDASSLFVDRDNTVTVGAELDPNVSLSAFNVNSLDISYPRAYRATEDRLRLRGNGNPVVTVDGFRGSHIAVLDISDPRKPRWLAATTVAPPGNDYSVSFVPATPTTDYFAAVPAAPVSVEGDTPSTLKTKSNGVDYLVLAPASLRSGADALADYRKGTGYSTQVVELQDIYDEFNDGIANPNAIRDFLRYAYRQWQPQPRYVALVGKGTFDPKNYLGWDTNRFPMLMTETPSGLFVSDNRYVDFNDDGKSKLAIGRISALTDVDVQNYVTKLQAYESGGGSQTTALLVADNPDAAGNFTAESEAVAKKSQSGRVEIRAGAIVERNLQIQEARQTLINTLLTA